MTTAVVMGVSGAGKTTVARAIAELTGWPYAEGDDFHPEANVAKMRSGTPLTDGDRLPWLREVARWIAEHERAGVSTVVTCSALRVSYRDVLREGTSSVFFVHVDVPDEVLVARVTHRSGHYMPASLLTSQLRTLERLQPGERGATVDGDAPPAQVAAAVLAAVRV